MKVCFLSLFVFSLNCYASSYQYDYKIIKVLDGDTVRIEAPYLPDPLPKHLDIRIIGIDTPEKGGRAKCESERQKSKSAKEFVSNYINSNSEYKIEFIKWDKFGGRIDGDVIFLNGEKLSQILIAKNFARSYFGGKKSGWCAIQ